MKLPLVILTFSLSMASANACGFFGVDILGVCKFSDQAKDSIDAIVKQLQQSQEYVVRNTPGLSDVAAVNDLASSNKDVRARAAERYRNLLTAAESLDKVASSVPRYKLAVSYEFDATKLFHVGSVRALDGSPETAKSYIDNNSIELWSDQARPKKANTIPPDDATNRQRLVDMASSLILQIEGNPSVSSFPFPNFQNPDVPRDSSGRNLCMPTSGSPMGGAPGCSAVNFSDSIVSRIVVSEYFKIDKGGSAVQMANDKATRALYERNNAVARTLVDLILDAYSYTESRVGNPNSTFDWSLTDGKNHVLFYVDKDTYDAQNDWKILVRVQAEADPSISLNQRPTRELHRSDFKILKASDGRIVYWADREMTGERALDQATIDGILAYKRKIDAIANAR